MEKKKKLERLKIGYFIIEIFLFIHIRLSKAYSEADQGEIKVKLDKKLKMVPLHHLV